MFPNREPYLECVRCGRFTTEAHDAIISGKREPMCDECAQSGCPNCDDALIDVDANLVLADGRVWHADCRQAAMREAEAAWREARNDHEAASGLDYGKAAW